MDIRVSGHQIDTGSALQEHAADRLGAIVEKYFDRALSSQVTFGKAPAGGDNLRYRHPCDAGAVAEGARTGSGMRHFRAR